MARKAKLTPEERAERQRARCRAYWAEHKESRVGRSYSDLPNEFFEACYWIQSKRIPMRVAAELAGIPTSTFHRNYPYWEGYIYDSDGRIIGEKCSTTNKRK